MKKIIISLLLSFAFTNIFAFKVDILGSINYKYLSVNGDTFLLDTKQDVPFSADFNSSGVAFGFDMFFNDNIGLYMRLGLFAVDSLNRAVGPYEKKIKGSGFDFVETYNLGPVFAFPVGNYFSFGVAPSFSMDYSQVEIRKGYDASIDSFLGFGVGADLFFKFRYKHFVTAAGCAGSFFPVTLITSADTKIDYHYDIEGKNCYNIRPYISFGVAF